MFEVTNVSGNPGGTSFLVTTEKSAFVCDTGFSFSAPDTAKNIRAALDGNGIGSGEGGSGEGGANLRGAGRLDYILLTHSHFDHAAGTPIIARAFPEAKIVASEYAAYVFTRSGARKMIASMDAAAARDFSEPSGEDTTSELRADITVGEGDVIRTPDETIHVYNTPGHTNCSISYYFENNGLLATSESSGFKFGGVLMPAFVTSYRDSLAAIELIEKLAPKYLLLPHSGFMSGEDVKAYPSLIREETKQKAEFVLSRHRDGMTEEVIIRDFVKEYYDGVIRATGLQTEESFTANVEAMVPRLLAESF